MSSEELNIIDKMVDEFINSLRADIDILMDEYKQLEQELQQAKKQRDQLVKLVDDITDEMGYDLGCPSAQMEIQSRKEQILKGGEQ